MKREDLLDAAREAGVEDAERLRGHDLVFAVGKAQGDATNNAYGRGVLEVHGEGFGFLRSPTDNFLPGADDIYVSQSQIRRFKLQTGDTVIGLVRPPKEGERYLALLRVESVNGEPPGMEPPSFDSLTAIYPDDRIAMATDPVLAAVDMVAPMGLGQRGLLVAPGRVGRTDILRRMAEVMTADEDLHVTVLLIGERPEEIGEWRKESRAEIIATPFDEPPSRHVQVADIAFERARRMVERGDDAVLIVDSLTRLLRFCLAEFPSSGREIDGVDATAIHRIRRYMGSARALEEGGSLTVVGVVTGDEDHRVARALLDDLREVVNWEVTLSRDLATRGIHPPLALAHCGTVREENLLDDAEQAARKALREQRTGDPYQDALNAIQAARTAVAGSTAAP
ncbi:MAG: transcription termination factor Rho [Alphaproteobacteria bacterium]|nr:transcription termination factor Rho [Alphaproteobacteria bacterium]